MRNCSFPILVTFFSLLCAAPASAVVSNVEAEQRADSQIVDITYDLAAEADISVQARTPTTDWEDVATVTGDVGPAVSAGTGKAIEWDAGADWPTTLFPEVQVRVLGDTGDAAIIVFADPALEEAVRGTLATGYLGNPHHPELEDPDEPITTAHVAGMTSLFAGPGIAQLGGLEYLTDLEIVRMTSTDALEDISPMAGLTNLTSLALHDTSVSDLSPLANLSALATLALQRTNVTDLSPLSELDSLGDLNVSHTNVADISPLAGLPSLSELRMESTQISDLSPLTDIENLSFVLFQNSPQVENIQPLLGVPGPSFFNLRGTGVDWCSRITWAIIENLQNRGQNVFTEDCDGPYELAGSVTLHPDDSDATWLFIDIEASGPEGEWSTSEHPGFWAIDGVEGEVTVTPRTDTYFWRFDPPSVTVDWPKPSIEFTAYRSETVIEGFVYDDQVEPLPDAHVVILPHGTNQEIVVEVSAAGFFSYEFDAPTTVDAYAVADGWLFSLVEDLSTPSHWSFLGTATTNRIALVDDGAIYVVDPDGSNREQVVAPTGNAALPAWSPDGSQLAFLHGFDAGGWRQVSRIDVSGGNQTLIVGQNHFNAVTGYGNSPDVTLQGPAWSVNGDIAYITWRQEGTPAFSPQQVRVTDADGGKGDTLLSASGGMGFNVRPDWSPNGSQLVLSFDPDDAGSGGDLGIYVVDADADQRGDRLDDGIDPAWSPDGERIAYRKDNRIWLAPANGIGVFHPLEATVGARYPTWSPDGEWIAYENDGQIYKIDAAGQENPIYITDGRQPAWSP